MSGANEAATLIGAILQFSPSGKDQALAIDELLAIDWVYPVAEPKRRLTAELNSYHKAATGAAQQKQKFSNNKTLLDLKTAHSLKEHFTL